MTCKLPVKCSLCEPVPVRRRDRGGRFATTGMGAWVKPQWWSDRKPSPFYVEGNLSYEISHRGRQSRTPHLEFCPGCLERMGVKLP